MEDRSTVTSHPEHLAPAPGRPPEAAAVHMNARDAAHSSPLADPLALTILTTEHWSLLSARSLVYNEAFSRAGMFLSFLAATLVALGLMSGAMGFEHQFIAIAALVLGLDLFLGLATMGRVSTATQEDIRYLQGMNRIRHAYHDAVPGLDDFFITGHHDDIAGIFGAYSHDVRARTPRGIFHGFTTVVGMLGVINAALAAVLAAALVLLADAGGPTAVVVGVVVFVLGNFLGIYWMTRALISTVMDLRPKFPTPADGERPYA